MNNSENANEDILTMDDILKEEEKQEEEYQAVLGGSDDKQCTYVKGYVPRQALYACLTCTPEARNDATKRAGVCLACSIKCHEGHEMIELYTKRNFRCDCGTDKMRVVRCTLDPLKLEKNDKNLYNQNFSGSYCVCQRPYPDPEDSTDDQMIQCAVCEDWLHGRHLNATLPTDGNFSEMICEECMKRCEFLKYYQAYLIESAAAVPTNTVENANVDVETVSAGKHKLTECAEGEPSIKQLKLDDEACTRPNIIPEETTGATFWMADWRKSLCKCQKCRNIYEIEGVSFLLDLEDTVQYYEELGSSNRETSYEQGMRALSTMDRTSQIEVLVGFNHLKDRLKDFLQEFVTNQQVVTQDDVKRFFTQLKTEKDADNVSVQNFCR